MTEPISTGSNLVLDKWKRLEEGGTKPTNPVAGSVQPLTEAAKKQLAEVATRAVSEMMTAKVYAGLHAFDVTVPSGSGVRTINIPFRMNGGHRVWSLTPPVKEVHPWTNLQAELAGSKLSPATMSDVVAGRGTPAQIAAVSSELARLHPERFDAKKTNDEVRDYLRACGVGIDCAGFVQQALCSIKGVSPAALGFLPLSKESLAHLGSNPHFSKVHAPKDLQPGDVITLKPPKPAPNIPHGEPGHTVVVAKSSTTKVSAGQVAALSARKFDVKSDDVLVRVDVVSSFGGDWKTNGPRMESWIYNERTQRWGKLEGGSIEPSTKSGPYDHEMEGMFHAK